MTTTAPGKKPIHSLVLDTGPLIKNTVSISTILNAAEELYTTPAIVSEIRDEATRSRVQTTLMPFLKIRNPSPASLNVVVEFSKKTGDYSVLSRQDLGVLALAYEIYCERNEGNYGLREAPKGPIKRRPGEEEIAEEKEACEKKNKRSKGKKTTVNAEQEEVAEVAAEEQGWEQPKGKRATKTKTVKPTKIKYKGTTDDVTREDQAQHAIDDGIVGEFAEEQGGVAITPKVIKEQEPSEEIIEKKPSDPLPEITTVSQDASAETQPAVSAAAAADNLAEQFQETAISWDSTKDPEPINTESQLEEQPYEPEYEEVYDASDSEHDHIATVEEIAAHNTANPLTNPFPKHSSILPQLTPPNTDHDDSDSDGSWITPSNLPIHRAKDSGLQSSAHTSSATQLDVATMTIDFAMQNVLLQMNLVILSTSLQRVNRVNTKVLRCQACFLVSHDTSKQFCPRCGQATLARVSCSTNAKGDFKIHLSRNYQYNKRGDRFSVPKPIAGTANGKWSGTGGGKGGWGRDLIFAEDQKEFLRKVEVERRERARDLMDEDYLPGLLTGERTRGGGRVKVGAGKDVNARKR